ncbi:MAG: GatB/YqeY domain-containing protein [Saprospiraceae bacterium]|nr:GatB/YqeY domain-containing protein [Saprospiraceae bacterium]HMW37970.1 GatB/YqeY domain-containing protein [Saprospiraceae bacterium]HMX87644.1 GatB/YqeY domain-containing protein [Saprospiraceae bacterium]HMZ39459.1 GatB/YqeY domain-containing protein [Saprospiraceae bacterium]HNA63245.1 GatB/YqeY domain-containing protein [Saprospiraceae bacterium]
MGFQDKINNDLKEAMKAKDEKSLRAIRAIKAAILLANTDGSGQEMNEERGIAIIQKLLKQRKESLEIYEKQNRQDLAVTEREEIEVISRYLPEQMSEEALIAFIQKIIQDTGASGPKDMGKVMGLATKSLAGQADGKTVSLLVKKLLEV